MRKVDQRRLAALLAGGVSMLAVTAAHAGDLRGAVTDANTGGRLQGATVRLQENGRTAVSDSGGAFAFPALPAGDYTVVASFVGYQPVTQTVTVGATGVVETSLSLGA